MRNSIQIFSGFAAFCAVLSGCLPLLQAASFTMTINPRISVQADCRIVNVLNLNFGSSGVLSANVDATTTMKVKCSNGANYNIGLDGGTTPGGSTAVRKMYDGTGTVDYNLYQDAARTINWGDNVGTDTLSATGTGGNQNYTIYGRVPVQSTPAASTYTDVVTLTLTF